jgi:hypothetical protein
LEVVVPRVQPKPKIDKEAVYVAFTSFGLDEAEFPGGVVKRGAEFRGSHVVVQRHPNYFIPIDTPKSEWPNELHALPEPSQHEPMAVVLEPLPASELMEATHPLRFGFGGANKIDKGQRLPKTHPVVRDNPEWFKEVKEDGE